MVEDHDHGIVDPLYLLQFFDQFPLKIRPEVSVREGIVREAEIEMINMQALLEVEEVYQSTLHVLRKDIKKARGDSAKMEAKIKTQVRSAQKELRGNVIP